MIFPWEDLYGKGTVTSITDKNCTLTMFTLAVNPRIWFRQVTLAAEFWNTWFVKPGDLVYAYQNKSDRTKFRYEKAEG